MQTNALPRYDDSVNTTGCCAKFNPEGWDGRHLHFEDKEFVRAETRSAMHIPINMGRVFDRVLGKIEKAGAMDPADWIVLSHDPSPWKAEHLFAASGPVEGEETAKLSGDFVTKVFEGPYRDMGRWHAEMQAIARAEGAKVDDIRFFYTTCPRCAKAYGQNYVVGVARVN